MEQYEFGAKDGLITHQEITEYAPVLDVLEKQDRLVDAWLELNSTFDAIRATQAKSPLDEVDDNILMRLQGELVGVMDEIKKTFFESSDENDVAEKQAIKDLRMMMITRQDKRVDDMFFATKDREKLAAAVKTDTGVNRARWYHVLFGKPEESAEEEFNARMAGVYAEHDQRQKKRQDIVGRLTTRLEQDNNILFEEGKKLSALKTIIEIMSMAQMVLLDSEYTQNQKILARRCLLEIGNYINQSEKSEQLVTKIRIATQELKQSLDIKALIHKVKQMIEGMCHDLQTRMSGVRRKVIDLQKTLKILPPVRVITEEHDPNKLSLEIASCMAGVEAAYQDVIQSTKVLLKQLQDGQTNPESVEGLVTTLQNGTADTLFLKEFNTQMAALEIAIKGLEELSCVSSSRQSLGGDGKEKPTRLLAASSSGPELLIRSIDESEAQETLKRMEDMFEDRFFGIDAAVSTFSLLDGRRLISLTDEERQEIIQNLHRKCQEQDIQEFLSRLKSALKKNSTLKKNLEYFRNIKLRYQPTRLSIPDNLGELRDHPLTMKLMQQILEPDMRKRKFEKLLLDTRLYKHEPFFLSQVPGNIGTTPEEINNRHNDLPENWFFAYDEIVADSLGVPHDRQNEALISMANVLGFNPEFIRRPTPVEVSFAQAETVCTSQGRNRLYQNPLRYHWTDVRTSGGNLVCVGSGGADGLDVYAYNPSCKGGSLGAALVR